MFWLFPPTGCSRADTLMNVHFALVFTVFSASLPGSPGGGAGTTEKMENACAIMNFRFCCAILDFASLRMCLTLDLRCCLHNVCNILKLHL